MHERMIKAESFSKEILETAQRMRQTLDIPNSLDSPFFIARFLTATDGDEDQARQRITEYLTHRQCLDYDKYSQLEVFTKCPIGKETFERFGISLIHEERTSHNVHVFVHRMKNTDLHEILRVIPLSYVLHSYFLLQDVFGRAIAKTEKETGKPSSVVCVLDLEALNISDYLNPLSAPLKLARFVVKIWADYFSETMCRLVLINPPSLVSLLWKISKWIMDARTLSKLTILHSADELHQLLEPQVIPIDYGGTWRDDSGYADPPESCCRQPILVKNTDHRTNDDVWKEHGAEKPHHKTHHVKGKDKIEISRHSNVPGSLIWSFTASGDIVFEIVRVESGKEKHVWPTITLTSLKLAEFGHVEVPAGEVILRFTNPSSTWLPVKLSIATAFKHTQ